MSDVVIAEEIVTDVPDTAEKILASARRLAPLLRTFTPEIEANRRLPSDVVDELRACGVFRAAMPKSWGGAGMTSMQQTELIETLAQGDVSSAWCSMIGMDSGIYSGFLSEKVAREVYPRLDMATSGWIHPQGRADKVDGGYLISGHWRFGSGITHCDVLVAGCLVYRDGQLEQDPFTGKAEQWRVAVGNPRDFEIRDSWFTTGLAGSGSYDYVAKDLFIPEERTFSFAAPVRKGPLHDTPDAILRKMAGIPLGMARACLDYVRNLAIGRVDRETRGLWVDDYRVQSAIAKSEMELAAARASVYASLQTQWEKLSENAEFSIDDRVATALARHNAFRTAREIVHRMYDLVGGTSVYKTSPMDRWLRDANTMCQHAVAQDSILQLTGNVLLGGKSTSPFF
ncbi:acyl-CoA dehydrogenase family protein [Chromobacterium vaccinii]|uniref:Acyl-CoA dehydrogenase family protein n=1 Tax=Chromobacterium vaccinii TaxID=1108595 RepID=A0ABV0F6Q7_9NEIS